GGQYFVDRGRVSLALDADFLACGPGALRDARDFAARRRPERAGQMNRLYAVESMPTSTGSRADHRLPLKPSDVEVVARRLASSVGVGLASGDDPTGASRRDMGPSIQKWLDAVGKDLRAHRGTSVVIAGETQP